MSKVPICYLDEDPARSLARYHGSVNKMAAPTKFAPYIYMHGIFKSLLSFYGCKILCLVGHGNIELIKVLVFECPPSWTNTTCFRSI